MRREVVDAWFPPPLCISLLECNSLERIVRIGRISSHFSCSVPSLPGLLGACLKNFVRIALAL